MVDALRDQGIYGAIGVNERESPARDRRTTAPRRFDRTGLISKRRRRRANSAREALSRAWAGHDLAVSEIRLGRIGGLICWEKRMPLAPAMPSYRGRSEGPDRVPDANSSATAAR